MSCNTHPHHHHHQPHLDVEYSAIRESITSICKNVLSFPFKNRKGLPPSHLQLAKLQSDNLKWQQESYQQILKLMGLHKEGILSGSQVSSYRSHLLHLLIAPTSPLHQDHTPILRDKLLFLKELYLAKCISEDEYHSSKRPLLQRLGALGAAIEATDVIVGCIKEESSAEEWSEIDLGHENVVLNGSPSSKSRRRSALKQIKGAASSVLGHVNEGSKIKWRFRKSKINKSSAEDDEKASAGSCRLVSGQMCEGQQTKWKRRPDGSSSDFFIDKVLGNRVRIKLSQIQSATSTSIQFTNEDIEEVSTKLPVDMGDLHRLFSKQWCEKYGTAVLDVVRKEFKDHVWEMSRAKEGRRRTADENSHPRNQQLATH
uniref:Uncharacterized protein n=2 Tax=Kalanchoe fedtschenkoi TaxID=63787 RepID=A0A7N0TI94_KALFE